MGELKDIREQQDNLMQRARTLANTVYLAGLGAYSKAGEGSAELYDQYARTGSEAYGDDAESKPKALLAGRGLFVSARKLLNEAPQKREELYEQFVATGKQERGENAEQSSEPVLAGIGAVATLRSQSQKLFDELVSAGEKERA